MMSVAMAVVMGFWQALSDQLSSTITTTRDKMMSQQFRISQRLQWAAGANSTLNSVVDEFQRATNRRTQALLVCDVIVMYGISLAKWLKILCVNFCNSVV